MSIHGLTLSLIVLLLSGCMTDAEAPPGLQDSVIETDEETNPCQPSDVLPVEGVWTLTDPTSAYSEFACASGLEQFRLYDATNKGFRLDATEDFPLISDIKWFTGLDCTFSGNDFTCPIEPHEVTAGNPDLGFTIIYNVELSGSFWREEAGKIDFHLDLTCEGDECVEFESIIPCTTTLSGGIRPESQDGF